MKEKKIKEKKEKDQKENKFLQIIKKKWLINGTTTLALVLIIIYSFEYVDAKLRINAN